MAAFYSNIDGFLYEHHFMIFIFWTDICNRQNGESTYASFGLFQKSVKINRSQKISQKNFNIQTIFSSYDQHYAQSIPIIPIGYMTFDICVQFFTNFSHFIIIFMSAAVLDIEYSKSDNIFRKK